MSEIGLNEVLEIVKGIYEKIESVDEKISEIKGNVIKLETIVDSHTKSSGHLSSEDKEILQGLKKNESFGGKSKTSSCCHL